VNKTTIALCVLWSVASPALELAAYHAWNTAHATPRIATLDVAEIYRLKEKQFTALLLKPGASEAERAQAIDLARTFAADLTALTQSLPRECGCLVLTQAAVVGGGNDITDLTPQIKRRFGL
jgi:hypothetical protein